MASMRGPSTLVPASRSDSMSRISNRLSPAAIPFWIWLLSVVMRLSGWNSSSIAVMNDMKLPTEMRSATEPLEAM